MARNLDGRLGSGKRWREPCSAEGRAAAWASFAATMRGVAHLQRNAIPFHVIAVLTRESLDHADGIVDFFLEHGIRDVGLNMEETEGSNSSSSLESSGCEQRYRTFLERVWERTAESEGAFRLREFETTCALACTDSRLDRTDMNRPFVILNVDHQGNFSTFDPELLAVKTKEYGDFVLGNILTDSLESVCATDKFQRILRDMRAGIERCRSGCDYFGLCGGGAGSNKYWERGTFDCAETQACRYRIKIVADVVMDGMENALGLSG